MPRDDEATWLEAISAVALWVAALLVVVLAYVMWGRL